VGLTHEAIRHRLKDSRKKLRHLLHIHMVGAASGANQPSASSTLRTRRVARQRLRGSLLPQGCRTWSSARDPSRAPRRRRYWSAGPG
jgi:hypothetical protein